MSETAPEPQPTIDRDRYADFVLAHNEVPYTSAHGDHGVRQVEQVYGIPREDGQPEEVSHEQMLSTFHDENLDNAPREQAEQPRRAERPPQPARPRTPRAERTEPPREAGRRGERQADRRTRTGERPSGGGGPGGGGGGGGGAGGAGGERHDGNGAEQPTGERRQPGERIPATPEAVGGNERAAIDPERIIQVQYSYSHLVEDRLRRVGGVNTLQQLRDRNPLMAEQLETAARFDALGEHFRGLFGEEEVPRRLYEDANHLMQVSEETLSQLQLRPRGEQPQPPEAPPAETPAPPAAAETGPPPLGPDRRWWQIWRRDRGEEPPRNRFVSRGLGIIAVAAAVGLGYATTEIIEHELNEGNAPAVEHNGKVSKGFADWLRKHRLVIRQQANGGGSNIVVTGSNDRVNIGENGAGEAREAHEAREASEAAERGDNQSAESEQEENERQPAAEGEIFNVPPGGGIIREIQAWAPQNGFERPSDAQASRLYELMRDQFGDDLVLTPGGGDDTYIRTQGDVGISQPGPARWPDNVEDWLGNRLTRVDR